MPNTDTTPAFPTAENLTDPMGHDGVAHYPGMTLRDWFAGQTLSGMMAHPGDVGSPKYVAELAYEQADAMMEARKT